jgi:hypothetical protein
MTADELNKLLAGVTDPIYKIEADLEMPKTTLQKALKGQRELSEKWERVLRERFWRPTDDELMKLPVDYNRPDTEYPGLIRRLIDRNSLLLLKYEIENSKILKDYQQKSHLLTLNLKLIKTKY